MTDISVPRRFAGKRDFVAERGVGFFLDDFKTLAGFFHLVSFLPCYPWAAGIYGKGLDRLKTLEKAACSATAGRAVYDMPAVSVAVRVAVNPKARPVDVKLKRLDGGEIIVSVNGEAVFVNPAGDFRNRGNERGFIVFHCVFLLLFKSLFVPCDYKITYVNVYVKGGK